MSFAPVLILVLGKTQFELSSWAARTTGTFYLTSNKVKIGDTVFYLRREDEDMAQFAGMRFDCVLHAGSVPMQILSRIRRPTE